MALLPLSFTAPGRLGVNLQEQDHLLRPEWALKTDNLVLNQSGKLHCRGAYSTKSTDGASTELLRMFSYVDDAGAEILIHTQAARIVQGTADLDDAATDITSGSTPTAGYWQFANFNGKVVGWQSGHTPIVKTTGDFANISAGAGTLPDGDCVLSAFGRLWAVDDDQQTIRYCALLDETDWSTASGGGSIDMRNVWTQGMDVVTGLAAFGANLIVFGRRHIIMYSDGQGSALGIDPTQMYVVDTIEGTGCIARDTIANIGEGDLVFLSETGLQSIRRLIQNKDNPLDTISWQIQDHIQFEIKRELAHTGTGADCRGWTGTYVASTGQYILVRNYTYREETYLFHMLLRVQDEKGRDVVPITYWPDNPYTNMRKYVELRDGTVYTQGGDTWELLEYLPEGTRDDLTTAIAVDYESGWISMDDPQLNSVLKLMKAIQVSVLNPAEISSTHTVKYAFDYVATMSTQTSNAARTPRVVEVYDVTGDVDGQYFKFGVTCPDFGSKTLQQVNLFFKPSRLAFVHDKDNQVVAGGEGGDVSGQAARVVAVGSTGAQRVAYTDDGVTWTGVTDSVAGANTWAGLAFSSTLGTQGRFVAVGANDGGMYSDDGGETWTSMTIGTNLHEWVGVDWSPELGLFVAVASNNAADGIAWSADGITWTEVDTATTPGGNVLAVDVKWISELGLFIIIGTATIIGNTDLIYSADGKNWTPIEISFTTISNNIAYSPHLGLAFACGVSSSTTYGYSGDGINWTSNSDSVAFDNRCLVWSPIHKAFVGANNADPTVFYTSEDAIDWTAGNSITGLAPTKILWAPDFQLLLCCGYGASEYMASSANGKTWTARTAFDANWEDMAIGTA